MVKWIQSIELVESYAHIGEAREAGETTGSTTARKHRSDSGRDRTAMIVPSRLRVWVRDLAVHGDCCAVAERNGVTRTRIGPQVEHQRPRARAMLG